MLREIPLEIAYTYFESGPVVLVTSSDGKKDNVMTISWMMVNSFVPTVAITTGAWNESFQTIIDTKECTLCVPGAELLDKVIGVGTMNGSEGDKFARFGLSKKKGRSVKAPLIRECIGCLECRLLEYIPEHDILVFEGVRMWKNTAIKEPRTLHANGDGTFFADGEFFNRRKEMSNRLSPGQVRF